MLLLVSSAFLFLMITARWAIGVARLYEAVVTLGGRVNLSAYFANIPDPKQIAVTMLFDFQVIVADFILVYRLYHVWKPHWWICIIPTIAWLGVCISAGFFIAGMLRANDSTGLFQDLTHRWIVSSFSCTISNNLFCTCAIILRLWRSKRSVAPRAGMNSYIWRVLRVFVESASLLTVFMGLTFITFLAGNTIQYSFADATSPVIGISFLLIMLRLAIDKEASTSIPSNHSANHRGTASTYPLRAINVSVSQHVDIDADLESKGDSRRSYTYAK